MSLLRAIGAMALALLCFGCATTGAPSGPSQRGPTAESMKGVKSTTEYSGQCTKALIAGTDLTAACYGWALQQIQDDGTEGFLFRFTGDLDYVFLGSNGRDVSRDHRVLDVSKTRSAQSGLKQETPGVGSCSVDGSLTQAPVVTCKADLGGQVSEVV